MGQIAVYSFVFGIGMYIVDFRAEVRQKHTDDLIVEELKRYRNVYTVDEIIDLVNKKHITDVLDLKKYIIDGNDEQMKALEEYIIVEQTKYDTIYFESAANNKYMLLGNFIFDKFYMIQQVEIDSFPYEKRINL